MTGINKYVVVLAALILVGCGPKEDQFVDAKAASALQGRGHLLLDIREHDGYKVFRIPNSTHIPFGRLKSRLDELAEYKAKPIVLIDYSGLRSPRAWEMLKKSGFNQVSIVKGGAKEWKEAGLPIETMEEQMESARLEQEQQLELEQLQREIERLKQESMESATQ